MRSPDDPWLCMLFVVLFSVLLLLRIKFPVASRRAETAVLAAATIVFFSLCYLLTASPASAARSAGVSIEYQANH